MNRFTALTIAFFLSTSGFAFAQSESKKDTDKNSHKGMRISMDKTMEMDMDAHQKMIKDAKEQSAVKKGEKHQTTATVRAADPFNAIVTLAHGPVESLKWPAMTMGFSVKDKMLFNKMPVGEKVTVEFIQDGAQYVVIKVK